MVDAGIEGGPFEVRGFEPYEPMPGRTSTLTFQLVPKDRTVDAQLGDTVFLKLVADAGDPVWVADDLDVD